MDGAREGGWGGADNDRQRTRCKRVERKWRTSLSRKSKAARCKRTKMVMFTWKDDKSHVRRAITETSEVRGHSNTTSTI